MSIPEFVLVGPGPDAWLYGINLGQSMVSDLDTVLSSWAEQLGTLSDAGVDVRPALGALAERCQVITDALREAAGTT